MAKQVKVFTGTQWDTLAVTLPDLSNYSTTTQMNTAIDSAKGLVLVNSTTFSSASSVTVDNVFTTSYDNYRVTLNLTAISGTDVAINWYGRTSGSDVTTNYTSQQFRFYGTTTNAASFSGAVIGAGTSAYATYAQSEMTLFNPQKAQVTVWYGNYTNLDSSSTNLKYIMYGNHTSTNQFDGIKIYPASGTISGTLRIYGYRNS